MTEDRLPLAELLAKSGDGDFLRTIAESVLQIIMEADVEGLVGAGRHERSGERTTWRNGYRDRSLDTRLGTLNLKIPKLRTGAYFPGFLEPRKTVEKALVAVIQEAWIAGVSTRRVDDLAPEEMPALEARLATIEKAIAKLAGLEMAEGEDQGEKGEVSLDAETIARAEILAPGLAKSKDMKAKSLTAAYGTEDGKAIIDTLLAGKAFDSADKDLLFVAASEMLKSARRGQLHSTRVSLDSLPGMKAGEMTPEKINQMNAARYGKQ